MYRLSDEIALVQTVDVITPVVDDPATFGAIAAANSVSDIYAMGARPLYALAVVGFPKACLPLDVLAEILRGGAAKMAEAGVPVIGGHTLDDKEPKYGLSVTGIVHPDRVLTNAGARPGDRLILTKPIGTGLITTAAKRDQASQEVLDEAVRTMAFLNKPAAEVASEYRVSACTDVTGFGLLGHLREMVSASGVDARVYVSRVPVLPGVPELAEKDLFPGGTYRNMASVEGLVTWAPHLAEWQRLLLCDAQTSGGLLFGVSAQAAAAMLAALREAGVHAAEVGEVIAGTGRVEVVS